MSRITLAAIATAIADLFADNSEGLITEADMRGGLTSFKDSFLHLDDFDTNAAAVTAALATKADDAATTAALSTKLVAADIANKQDIEAAAAVGVVLRMDKTAVHGTFAAPVAGNFSYAGSGGKLGIVVVAIHQAGGEPSYSGEFHKLQTSRPYSAGQKNYYTFTYVSASRIVFTIDQE